MQFPVAARTRFRVAFTRPASGDSRGIPMAISDNVRRMEVGYSMDLRSFMRVPLFIHC